MAQKRHPRDPAAVICQLSLGVTALCEPFRIVALGRKSAPRLGLEFPPRPSISQQELFLEKHHAAHFWYPKKCLTNQKQAGRLPGTLF
ncbi:MAG TPA: hypothetical protein VHC22_02485 [Pirellulales bacterium]|nr:hypothetical protein [Pirellulales bacterium]